MKISFTSLASTAACNPSSVKLGRLSHGQHFPLFPGFPCGADGVVKVQVEGQICWLPVTPMASKCRRITLAPLGYSTLSISSLGPVTYSPYTRSLPHPFQCSQNCQLPSKPPHSSQQRSPAPNIPTRAEKFRGQLSILAQILLFQRDPVTSHLKWIISFFSMSWKFPVSRCC